MRHGSLFSGIGGFDLGFERAGIETVWQVELDEYCRRVLAQHFPRAQRFSDIRECGAQNLPAVDIISGGFPCQDISNAGKRVGIDGERSGLWSEYARIIRELRPRYVVVENVAALLGRGMERVLGDLAAVGYDAEWQSIRASDVGAPHRRERIWIVAYAASDLRRASGHEIPDASDRACANISDASGIRLLRRDGVSQGQQHRRGRPSLGIFNALYSDVSNAADDWPGRRQQFAQGGESERNVAYAQVSESRESSERQRREDSRRGSVDCRGTSDSWTEALADADGGRLAVQRESSRSGGLASRGRETLADADGGRCEQRVQGERGFSESNAGSLGHPDESPENACAETGRSRRAISKSSWWATEPDVGRVANGVSARVDRLRGLGNAIVPQIAEWIGRQIVAAEAEK